MREIKFRGRDRELFVWRYGDLDTKSSPDLVSIIEDCDYSVDPKSVGQFTGLKDSNGKEIYEGDVIRLDEEVYAVTWNDYSGCWSVEFGGMGLALLTQYSTKDSTVIGNIYDNPELLEAKA